MSTLPRHPSPAPRRPLLREVYGRLLRGLRTRQGRTLAQVSTAAGVSLAYLSEVERGLKEPSSEVLEAICVALGSSVTLLVGAAHRELSGLTLERLDGPLEEPAVLELTSVRSVDPWAGRDLAPATEVDRTALRVAA
ncbi:helix-turn-helix domain-containing protein [Humibacillus xanthopallidus]|uniref:helix-turn-helix domain-containing protein n=1 Tax=Humibacillus xanthopallidus TaxID=412689 RepID=UPI00384F57A5